MKTYVFAILLVHYICLGQDAVLTTGIYTGPNTFSEDPNLNPNWDWEHGDVLKNGIPRYYIFLQNRPNAVEEYEAVLPWYQQSAWGGLSDRKKEDGWMLLARDFGSPERRLLGNNPYFVLYNSYRSTVRIFVLLLNVPTSFTFSTMELKTIYKESGVLAHLAPIAYAMDKVGNMYNNATSVAIPSLAASNYWVYGDFPLALDNTVMPTEITEKPASLIFDIYGTVLTDVKLETDGFGAQGNKKFIQDFMAKNNFGSPGFSLRKGDMPNLDIPFNLPDVSMKATAPDWRSFLGFFDNLYVDLDFGSLTASNPFKPLYDKFSSALSVLSFASPIGISGLDLGGMFKFFIGGGMKQTNIAQTPPMFISSHYSSTGTLTTKNRFASVTIPLPASRQNFNAPFTGGEVGIVCNDPVGLLTLVKTPIIYKRTFNRYTIIPPTPDCGPRGIPCPGAKIPHLFNEYELIETPQIELNKSSGLNLISCEASLVIPITNNSNQSYQVNLMTSKAAKLNDQKYLIDFESPINQSSALFRSLPVPVQLSKNRTLQTLPTVLDTDLKLQIKAIFQRKDDLNTQPIVFFATYSVELINKGYAGDSYIPTILPTIPPQNIKCNVPSTGGVRVSWDRNRERNIKYYAIERSINNGAYVQITTTSDTVFTDNEVQKSIKPYQSNRQNVSVNYRVRARSEWTDDDGSNKAQFSAYSDIITIQGSIMALLEKSSITQIIPSSNSLSQNFPNPFNPTTTIHYGVKEEGVVTIKIFNVLGQEITTLVNERKDAGYHYAEWDATGSPSGMYFYHITAGNFSKTQKMMLLK